MPFLSVCVHVCRRANVSRLSAFTQSAIDNFFVLVFALDASTFHRCAQMVKMIVGVYMLYASDALTVWICRRMQRRASNAQERAQRQPYRILSWRCVWCDYWVCNVVTHVPTRLACMQHARTIQEPCKVIWSNINGTISSAIYHMHATQLTRRNYAVCGSNHSHVRSPRRHEREKRHEWKNGEAHTHIRVVILASSYGKHRENGAAMGWRAVMQMREMRKNGSECRLFDMYNAIVGERMNFPHFIFISFSWYCYRVCVLCTRALRLIRGHIKWHACALHCCSLLRLMVILFKKPFMHSVCVFIVSHSLYYFIHIIYTHASNVDKAIHPDRCEYC